MADFNNFGIQSTEEFSVDSPSAIDDFLNGTPPAIEKADAAPKKDKEPKAPVKDIKKEKEKEEEEPEEEQPGVLDVLDEEEKEEEPSKEKEKEEEPATNQFEVISQQLYDMGIFLQDEGEEEPALATTGEELAGLFQQNAQKQAYRNLDNFLRQRGDDRMDLFEAIFVNGVDPKEYLPVYNRVQDFESLDISSEVAQERVIREYYSRLKWSPEKINSKVQKLKDYGDLEEEAQEVHPKIIDQDKEVLTQQEESKKLQEQQKKAADEQYKGSVQKVLVDALKAKELEGFPLTEADARSLYSYLVEPKYKLPNGDLITEYDKLHLESKRPENIKQRAIIALLQLKKFDFSKIEKKAISKETNELFSGLKKTALKSKAPKPAQTDFWGNQL